MLSEITIQPALVNTIHSEEALLILINLLLLEEEEEGIY